MERTACLKQAKGTADAESASDFASGTLRATAPEDMAPRGTMPSWRKFEPDDITCKFIRNVDSAAVGLWEPGQTAQNDANVE
jgi:hypothetical protein